jgi:hypothetical protein
MSFTAVVENDTIKLPPGVHLPDGTKVSIEPAEAPHSVEAPRQTFGQRYAKYIGCLDTGLGDLAENHDHYLYGTPKREK